MSTACRGRLEPVLFFAIALAVYVGLAADSFYKVDGIDIVRLLYEGGEHPWHVGYLPALAGFRRLLELVSLSPTPLQLGTWFSALGGALGVGFARAGMARLGIAAATARLATIAFALSPGLLTFATVVEFHGPMLGPLGLAFWWTTVQVKNASWWGMALLGALCHLPFLIHSQQLFLPVWLLAFFVAKRSLRRRDLMLAALAGSVHAALILGLPQLLPDCYGYWAKLGEGFATEASIGRPQSLDYTPQIFLQEWLGPLLPLSLFAFTALLGRSLRAEFAAFALGFLPYLYLSVRQLVFEPEFGAYMLPMVLPAAMLTAQRLGPRVLSYGLLALGIYQWLGGPFEHLLVQKKGDDWFAVAVQQGAGEAEPFVLVGSHRELGSAYARLAPGRFLWVRATAAMPRAKASREYFEGVGQFLRLQHQQGRAVLVTKGALASLDDPRAAMLAEKATLTVPENTEMAGPVFATYLRTEFDLVAAAQGEIWRLVPKR
ncbi:MAG: hypothetical protein KDC98_25850 [Planctomycetes bacterium]|nr:hypothetical protein [Planctomycetota bacterium]